MFWSEQSSPWCISINYIRLSPGLTSAQLLFLWPTTPHPYPSPAHPLTITVLVIISLGFLVICFNNKPGVEGGGAEWYSSTQHSWSNEFLCGSLGRLSGPGNIGATASIKYGHLNGLNQSYDNFRWDLTNNTTDLASPICNVHTFYIFSIYQIENGLEKFQADNLCIFISNYKLAAIFWIIFLPFYKFSD